jgi:hypothetical protein
MNVTAIPDALLLDRVKLTFLIRQLALTLMRTATDYEGVEKVLKDDSGMVMRVGVHIPPPHLSLQTFPHFRRRLPLCFSDRAYHVPHQR